MAQDGVVAICTARYSFKGENELELSYKKGDVIKILKNNPEKNWWEGIGADGKKGFFSKNYVVNVKPVGLNASAPPMIRQNSKEMNQNAIAAALKSSGGKLIFFIIFCINSANPRNNNKNNHNQHQPHLSHNPSLFKCRCAWYANQRCRKGISTPARRTTPTTTTTTTAKRDRKR